MKRLALACVALLACGDDPPPPDAIARSVDGNGVPRMIDVHAGVRSPVETIEALAPMWGVKQLPALTAIGDVPVGAATVSRIRQSIDGLPVWGGELRMLGRGDRATVTGTLRDAATPRSSKRFIAKADALARVVPSGHVLDDSLARQVWFPSGGVLVAAWAIDAYTSDPNSTSGDAHRTILAGDDGRVLEHYSLSADAAFSYRVYAETTGELHPLDGPQEDATPHPTGAPDGSYPAYLGTAPLVSVDGLNHPAGGGTDSWLAPTAVDSRGNNVDAYVDLMAPDGLSVGDFRANASGTTFDYAYNTAAGPLTSQTQQKASITSLFYTINWLHDFWYDAGFTEVAGNAQLSNYGRGGEEDDVLKAESQDNANGGSRNNANMQTPDDGMSPRMQVFIWTGKDTRTLALSPSGRAPVVGGAVFGPKNFDVTGQVVIGVDGAGVDTTDGCEAFTGNVTGKIVLVNRGNCTFKRKALNAQNASAIGVLLTNNTAATSPPSMGDDSTLTVTITIPMLSVTDVEGAMLEDDIEAGATTAVMHRDVSYELDGALDSTLVAHEFGHYLHHRLTLCGNKTCRALSEGWGDFTALMLLARPGDDLDGAFPFSVYTTQGTSTDPGYYGIRRAPYSVDFAINSLSFRHMADGEPVPTSHPFQDNNENSEVHNAGEVWTAALWEGYVALQKAGTSFDEVRAKMARYVVAGLLVTPVEATPMEARDAILAAAAAESAADHDLLLAAFARRGFGSCAIAPAPSSTTFEGLVESTIIAGNVQIENSSINDACDDDGILDSGEIATVSLQLVNRGHAPITDLSVDLATSVEGISITSPPTQIAKLDPGQTTNVAVTLDYAPGVTELIDGEIVMRATASGGCTAMVSFPIASRLNVDEVPLSSKSDNFDTAGSLWLPWTAAWSHERRSSLDGYWHGDNLTIASDTRLTSPYLVGHDTEPTIMTFDHVYSFEESNGVFYDGGVIEYSIGTDEEWQDASMLVDPGYTGTLTDDDTNVLFSRPAYADTNPSYPSPDTVTLNFGNAFAGSTFRVRFRIGTDNGTGREGWDVDNVVFSGIVGTPFTSLKPDAGECGEPPDPYDPIISGGGGCCDTGRSGDSVFAIGVLALVLRRRRRGTVRR